MLSIVTGSFHPELESALVSQVRSLKQDDPLAPLAIIVPSQQLARRVKWLLAVEQGLALLDVHVLPFHQLAVTLIEEGRADRPAIADGMLREELLRCLVARGVPGSEAFRDWAKMRGLWGGLWATIQDLKEARVDPSSVLSAVGEKMLGAEDPERLAALIRLYGSVLAADRELCLADPDDLATCAVERIPHSAFLARMRRVCYYGFYDLTQGQLDLFKAVASACPTSVFFPLRRDIPAYRFAQRFFEAYIQGMAIRVEGGPAKGAPPTPTRTLSSLADEIVPGVRGTCRIISAVGLEDEVSAAAKEMLRLIEDQGYDPLEIGVVARTLDPYLPTIRRVFEENRVPFACPVGEPLIHQPLAKTIIRFLRLRVESFPRASVLNVLTSPAFRIAALCKPGRTPHPDQWEWITRRLGITRGDPADGSLGEWRRLERAIQPSLERSDEKDTEKELDRAMTSEQMALLWALVTRLHADLSALPARASWGEYAEQFVRLLPLYFDLPAWSDAQPATHYEHAQAAIRGCLDSVKKLDVLGEEVSLKDWTDLMVRALERARLPSETRNQTGVQVLDAMDARGVPFRALFVLGLNEKVFPRSIREDALLRDADREALAGDLGFKIALKLDGFEEERLLFALLLRSAQERLYLSYQRAGRAGRTLVPSGYLIELQREMGHAGAERERKIKRRPSERWAEWPYEPLLLTAREMGLRLILQGGSPRAAWRALYAEPDLLEQGMSALKELESAKAGLTPFDGLVGPVALHWAALARRGAAPTSLERYAQCPFRYFAAQVLRLQPMDAPESVVELDARSRGELCHALLRAFYERLQRDGGSVAGVATDDAVRLLAEVARPVFAAYEEHNWVGYPLLWLLAQEEVLRLVEQLLREDLRELRLSGFVPTLFEVAARGRFGSNLPAPLQAIPVRGVLDRVDVRKENGQAVVRVVDYKYTQSGEPRDRDLATAAVRGVRLQPPLYLLAAKEVLGEPAVPESAAFYFLAPNRKGGPVDRSLLDASCWTGETGALIGRTLTVILEGIRAGRFFILPGAHCDHCDYSEVCRRHHTPSWWRARGDESRKELETLHLLKAPKADTESEKTKTGPGKKERKKRGG